MTRRTDQRLTLAAIALVVQPLLGAQPALFAAAQAGDVDILGRLLREGASVDAKNTNGDTLLILAASENHTRAADMLLTAGASLEAINNNGDTALIVASTRGHLRVVELLLGKNAALGTVNKAGDSALLVAVQHRRTDVAKLLIRRIPIVAIAILELENKVGLTALECANRNGDAELEQLLREKGATKN